MGLSSPLGGLPEEPAPEEEVAPLVDPPVPACLAHIFLWGFQSAFWQSREQYCVTAHFAHRLRTTSGGLLWQLLQELILGDVRGQTAADEGWGLTTTTQGEW